MIRPLAIQKDGTWYMLQGLLENSRFDMMAHKNDATGKKCEQQYHDTQKEIQRQKELLNLAAGACLC